MIAILRNWLIPPLPEDPYSIDWLFNIDDDDDESSPRGFNEPTSCEPGDEEENE